MTDNFTPARGEAHSKMSYSSYTKLACPRRYAHYKVYRTKVDHDADTDTINFRWGKAYHLGVEAFHNGKSPNWDEIFISQCFNSDEDSDTRFKIKAAVLAYMEYRKGSGIKCIAAEFEVGNDKIQAFLDGLLLLPNGRWEILDLKTAKTVSGSLKSRLHFDMQLNLYAAFINDIAKMFKLKVEDFNGCRYSVIQKPAYVVRINKATGEPETIYDYVKRNNLAPVEFFVPFYEMNPVKAKSLVELAYDQSMEMRKIPLEDIEQIPQNFSECEKFYKPCEYWSQCYGKCYTESDKVQLTYKNLQFFDAVSYYKNIKSKQKSEDSFDLFDDEPNNDNDFDLF